MAFQEERIPPNRQESAVQAPNSNQTQSPHMTLSMPSRELLRPVKG